MDTECNKSDGIKDYSEINSDKTSIELCRIVW